MFNSKCIIMVLFLFDSSQPRLSGLLNSILLLLYRLQDAFEFVPLSSHQRHDLVVAIRLIVRFGKSLGCCTYDV